MKSPGNPGEEPLWPFSTTAKSNTLCSPRAPSNANGNLWHFVQCHSWLAPGFGTPIGDSPMSATPNFNRMSLLIRRVLQGGQCAFLVAVEGITAEFIDQIGFFQDASDLVLEAAEH